MDKTKEESLPIYHDEPHEGPLSYQEAPRYQGAEKPPAHEPSTQMTLTLDPTGMFIKELPSSDAPPLYTLNKSLLHVHNTTSIHISRPKSKGHETSSLVVYAIGEHFISPLHPVRKLLQNVTVARTHGLAVEVGLRKIVWDFSTHVPLSKGEGMDGLDAGGSVGPTDPVYLIGVGNGPGTVQKHLLQFYDGKWEDDDDEVLAREREGGVECEGMPLLSVAKDLDQEMMDFLVAAWCVTMWGEVGKRVRRMSKGGDAASRRWRVGMFTFGHFG